VDPVAIGTNPLESLPTLLLNLKSNDKRIVSFLQKHLSKKNLEHNPLLKDPIPIQQGNSEFIISMAKQGVNCFMEPPLISQARRNADEIR